MQSTVSASAAIPIGEGWGRGNDGVVESVENQPQVFHASHRPLKISQNRRDFHIPTAPACAAWKSGKPKTGFPLSHPAHATTMTVLVCKLKDQRKEVGRYAASSFSCPDFMLILQLENAGRAILPAAAFQAALSGQTRACVLPKRRLQARVGWQPGSGPGSSK